MLSTIGSIGVLPRSGLKTIREWASKMQTHFEANLGIFMHFHCLTGAAAFSVTRLLLRHPALKHKLKKSGKILRTRARCRCEPQLSLNYIGRATVGGLHGLTPQETVSPGFHGLSARLRAL